MLQLVVFLGNPGSKYEANRHNAAWMLMRQLPFFSALDWQKKYKGLYASIDGARLAASSVAVTVPEDSAAAMPANSTSTLPPAMSAPMMPAAGLPTSAMPAKFHLLMPQTYMNLSGESAQAAAAFYKIKLDEIIVVHDEIELPFGTLSLKFSGGLGGHNGLRSMKAVFGSVDFWRLRIGIGRPDSRIPGKGGNPESSQEAGIAEWVLNDFTSAEKEEMEPVFKKGANLLLQAVSEGPENLLPEWTKKNCIVSTDT